MSMMWRSSSLSALTSAFRQSQYSPSQLLDLSLDTARKLESFNVFVSLANEAELRISTQDADARWRQGAPVSPLDGIPLAVKDNFCVRSHQASCGSSMLQSYHPPYDATVVKKATEGGAYVIGKTNLDEFGMGSGGIDSIFGPTKSIWRSGLPYDLIDRDGVVKEGDTGHISEEDSSDFVIAGGSSGGSASAVVSGACHAALGSDTGGSVRIPGAWNGLVTLKPSYGALSRHGLVPLVNSLDVPGIMARRVDDVAAVFNLIKGSDPFDSTTQDETPSDIALADDPSLTALSVGIPEEYACEGMSEDVLNAWSEVIKLLEANGVKVKNASLPHTEYSISCYAVLNPCEVASNMARYDGLEYGFRGCNEESTEGLFAESRSKGFNDVVRGRILAGNFFLLKKNYEDFFLKALRVRRLVKQDFDRAWLGGSDVLLTPVTLGEAPTYKSFSRLDNRTQTATQDFCTQPVNLAGLPAVTVPVKLSAGSSLPIGLQIIGQLNQEQRVLELAKWLENRLDFPTLKLR